MSQERLAEALGITFQQVQKYEKASNRVSASKLFEIASALAVEPSYFFAGLGDDSADPPASTLDLVGCEFISSADGRELARELTKIKRRARRKIIELVRALAVAEAR